MRERCVSADDVRHALDHITMTQGTSKKTLYIGPSPNGRLLKVWCWPPELTGGTTYVVKSVAWKDDDAE